MNNNVNNDPPKNNKMGLAIALGAGLGLVLGQFVFDDAGMGLVMGAGIGVAFGGINKARNNTKL